MELSLFNSHFPKANCIKLTPVPKSSELFPGKLTIISIGPSENPYTLPDSAKFSGLWSSVCLDLNYVKCACMSSLWET